MPRAQWPLLHGRPIVQIVLTLAQGGMKVTRNLLADTGAGDARSVRIVADRSGLHSVRWNAYASSDPWRSLYEYLSCLPHKGRNSNSWI